MTDKPIPFTGPMVRALLDGRKTQTRRVLKPQLGNIAQAFQFMPGKWRFVGHDGCRVHQVCSIPYANGDRLWVREAWKTDRYYDDLSPSEMGGEEPLLYACDCTVQRWGGKPDALSRWGRIRQHQHMPRWASRLTLVVTDVRVQRVQEISYADTCAEGVDCETCVAMGQSACYRKGCGASRQSFRDIWDSLNAKRGFGWAANPWVAAYTFTVHHCNIDQMEAA